MIGKSGVPAKRREIQQRSIQGNEQAIEQLQKQIDALRQYQDDPEKLQDDIDSALGTISVLKDETKSLKFHLKADEDSEIEEKAKKLQNEKIKENKPELLD